MSLASGVAIDNLRLQWIPYSQITNIEPTQVDNVYYAKALKTPITLVLLGSNETCTPTLVSEFARVYSLATHKYSDVNQFRRYYKWLDYRNRLISGITKSNDNYYMVAKRTFYYCYSRYGFCAVCRILRCSPVWCICGHKQLSDGWTSNNKRLDEFIKISQLQTNSANDAYLEWIPFDCIGDWGYSKSLYGLPTIQDIEYTPLAITDGIRDSYYAKLCDRYPDMLATDVWFTIGFTYKASERKYSLITNYYGYKLCLACTKQLKPEISVFCYECKAPRPVDWTTGNKSLDSFIMASWENMETEYDIYIQWIEYSLLTNVQEMTSLRHGCTHIANWQSAKVTLKPLKPIVNDDFYQLTEEYATPDNIWIIGITREPSTRKYYLVFYYEIRAYLDRFIRRVKYIPYSYFDQIKEIGSGGYGTVYTAKKREYPELTYMPETVVLKRFKSFDETPELFMSEFRNHFKCAQRRSFLKIYGVTQDPATKEYLIVMQYANNGNLLSYLDQNINKLTWKDKLQRLRHIARCLCAIHGAGIVHCDLNGGNIVMHDNTHIIKSFICDLGLSRSVKSHKSNSTIRGVLPFIAPEAFRTRKFTQKSDVYSLGIIMYLVATGEPPFRNRESDKSLACDIMGGLRPTMPDSAPEEYKKLAERCWRPSAWTLWDHIEKLIQVAERDNSDDNTWNTVYHNDVKLLSRLEKESKYSSKLLPAGDLPKPRNSYDLDSAADMKITLGVNDVMSINDTCVVV